MTINRSNDYPKSVFFFSFFSGVERREKKGEIMSQIQTIKWSILEKCQSSFKQRFFFSLEGHKYILCRYFFGEVSKRCEWFSSKLLSETISSSDHLVRLCQSSHLRFISRCKLVSPISRLSCFLFCQSFFQVVCFFSRFAHSVLSAAVAALVVQT